MHLYYNKERFKIDDIYIIIILYTFFYNKGLYFIKSQNMKRVALKICLENLLFRNQSRYILL